MQLFSSVKKKIDDAVNYQGRGNSGRFIGQFPTEFKGIVSPSKDAIGHFPVRSGVLEMADFCYPDLFVWYPEAEFQRMYPRGVPPCKWCGSDSRCVMRYSWMPAPRRGHSDTRNTAILSRVYYCATRKSSGMKPYFFSGIDKEVINNSPDYVKMRWRMDGFDISHRSAISLSVLRQHDGLYCGDLLETEIEKMAAWRQREGPPHPEWVSTRSIESTGEMFGFLTNDSNPNTAVDGNSSDESICTDAFAAEDELQELEDGINELEALLASQLPASSQWMAGLHGKFRPYGKVIGNVEWEYFTANLAKFQGRAIDEADNHCSIRFSDFAESWNKWVDSLGVREPTVTYKTAAYLKDAFKSMKRRAVQSSTLRPHKHALDELHTRHTCEESNRDFLEEMPALENAPPIRPIQQQHSVSTTENQDRAVENLQNRLLADEQNYHADDSESDADSPDKRRRKKRRKNSKLRCRRCGKQYALPEWKPYHINNKPLEEDWGDKRASSRHLRNGLNNKVWDHCTVDPVDFEPGFPVYDPTRRLPQQRKNIRNS